MSQALLDEERRKHEKPTTTPTQAAQLAASIYNINSTTPPKSLDSYDDRNFYISPSTNNTNLPYLFKVHNGVESDNLPILQAQNAMMKYLTSKGFQCSTPVESLNGKTIEYTTTPQRRFAVRVLSWVKGSTLNSLEPTSERILLSGRYLGQLRSELDSFDHPGCHREHLWDIRETLGLRRFLHALDTAPTVQAVAKDVVDTFESIKDTMDRLKWGTLQADFNDANIIFDTKGTYVVGVIDFGDIVYSNRINDVAIAMAYSMLKPPKGMTRPETAAALLQGYCETMDIDKDELSVLRTLVACRLATSVTLGAYSSMQDTSGNAYLQLHAQPGRVALCAFWNAPKELVNKLFQEASEKGMIVGAQKKTGRNILMGGAIVCVATALFGMVF